MKLAEIISAAASAYPDGLLHGYWDPELERIRDDPDGGDTLAQFIVRELCDSYDPAADGDEQVAAAVRALETAQSDLRTVADGLQKLEHRREKSRDGRPMLSAHYNEQGGYAPVRHLCGMQAG